MLPKTKPPHRFRSSTTIVRVDHQLSQHLTMQSRRFLIKLFSKKFVIKHFLKSLLSSSFLKRLALKHFLKRFVGLRQQSQELIYY
jgi:hypothetical protein